jgi:hypothetical protein
MNQLIRCLNRDEFCLKTPFDQLPEYTSFQVALRTPFLKEQECPGVEEFIHRHKCDGVLLLKATYEIRMMDAVKSKQKASFYEKGILLDQQESI